MVYLLFAGDNYYPGHPIDDFVGSYMDYEAAKTEGHKRITASKSPKSDWYQILSVLGKDVGEALTDWRK